MGSRSTGPADALVYLEDAPAGKMPKGPFEMTQAGKTFLPSVVVVPQGGTVSFPNLDTVLHNVFSLSPAKTFDLQLHKPGESPSVTFDKTGIISVFCNIHPQMVGYIVVVNNPHYVHPDASGAFQLDAVPPGTYQLVAWFPFGQLSRQPVTVSAGGESDVEVVLHERSDAGRHNRKDGSAYVHY